MSRGISTNCLFNGRLEGIFSRRHILVSCRTMLNCPDGERPNEGAVRVQMREADFEEVLPYLETLNAQIGAIVQLLKDKGMTTNEEFAQYVQRADTASNVRERRLRVRMEYLFTRAAKRSAE